jgi:hypothetical protein
MIMRTWGAAVFLVLVGLWTAPSSAADSDRHSGYYFPTPRTEEIYKARAKALPETNRKRRIGFTTALYGQMATLPYAPPYAVFAKGEEADKLIIVALRDGEMNTIYRARAVLAMMTANARSSQYFQDHHVEDYFTFFDLAVLLGFTQITVSDGHRFAHRILLR